MNEPKLAVLAYLPPNGKFHTSAFLENLRRNPPKNPLVTFSENGAFQPTLLLKHSPELVAGLNDGWSSSHPPCGVNNLIFVLSWTFAWKLGFTHFIYLEEDCRMRGLARIEWDQVIFDQFFAADPRADLIMGGSMVLWNICNHDRETARRGFELLAKWNTNLEGSSQKERNFPIPFYGSRASNDGTGACVLVNGAGGVYSVEGLRMLMPEIAEHDDNPSKIALAKSMKMPWDFFLGQRLWNKFKADAFDKVAHLSCQYSSYGDVLSSEEERIEMLRSGRVVLVHQIKNGNIIE